MRPTLLAIALLLAPLTGAAEIVTRSTIDTVWAGHPVGFALLTSAPNQFVAYYDADRTLVVASRTIDAPAWTRIPLPQKVAWDSHNYLTMTLDDQDHLHVSGNMHCVPLVYFRSTTPRDISTLVQVGSLVGREEEKMTYPRFFRGPNGDFIYTYRNGKSGDGNQIYNVYTEETDTWTRLLDTPLTDGEGKRNAYLNGPTLGADGYYHVVWVWRETPDCATNHDISYMRSRDLHHWENMQGKALALPVTLESPGVIVDPVPEGGGLINGNATFGFDLDGRVVVTYHKYDAQGNSQVYNARWHQSGWTIVPATHWDSRWSFGGGGSIDFDVRVQPVQRDEAGRLVQEWSHWQMGQQRWQLDPATLDPLVELPGPPGGTPPGMNKAISSFPGMEVRTASDMGASPTPGTRYMLRWETLGRNRDKPRDPPFPDATPLEILTITD